MTHCRILFTAQKNGFISAPNFYNAFDTLQKARGRGHTVVKNIVICIIKLVSFWPAPQFFSQKDIFHACLLDGKAEGVAVKMRNVSGVWTRSYIDKYMYQVLME